MDLPHFKKAYTQKYDLMNCEEEPIHIIRYLQSHAVLLAATKNDFEVTNTTENVVQLGRTLEDAIGTNLPEILPDDVIQLLQTALEKEDFRRINPIRTRLNNKLWNIIAHTNKGSLMLEFEPADEVTSSVDFIHKIDNAIQVIQRTEEIDQLLKATVKEIKTLTQFDRVMIYQFDEEYNGQVVAEALEEGMEPYLDLRYPASDIPKQARDLYLKNSIRVIQSVSSTPTMIVPSYYPDSKAPIDLTYSVARGTSPIHLEYLTNMGVEATMSVAIQQDNRLWGLIACHHRSPKLVDYKVRDIVRFLGRIISGHLSLQSAQDYRQSILKANLIKAQLVEQMSSNWNIVEGLLRGATKLTSLNNSKGAAIYFEGQIFKIGKTPKVPQLKQLIEWLNSKQIETYYQTNELGDAYTEAKTYAHLAAGLLAIRISQKADDYVLWFKPAITETVAWGGKPDKLVIQTEEGSRVSPRKSFSKWEEKVAGKAEEWQDYDLQVALALRNDIKDFIVQKYQEVKQMNEELVEAYEQLESFSYTVSHDLRTPLRSIDGFAQILVEDYGDQLDDYAKSLIKIITDNVKKMNNFIDDILKISKLGNTQLIINEIDLKPIIHSIEKELRTLEDKDRIVELNVQEDLPAIFADYTLIYQLLQNLLSNAFKYTRKEEAAKIEISGSRNKAFTEIHIKDNGIGMEKKYIEKAFEIFSRLVTEEEFEGTGIGLAIVSRIIHHHKGTIKVHSQPGKGAAFVFQLPVVEIDNSVETY